MIKIEFDIENNRSIAYDNDVIVGICEFINNKDTWNITHTEVDNSYQGQGIAKRLLEIIIEEAKKNNKKLVAQCSYAAKKLNNNMKKILIVEDDEKIRKELEIFLNKHGFEAIGIKKFDNIIEDILKENADLILLDINLPYYDGQYILKEIRKTSNVPIIMVTSRDTEIDELISLNYGADQYVTKPYNLQILLAKIAGLLKRVQNAGVIQDKMDCTKFILNISQNTIEKEDKKIELTKNEFRILHYLALNRNKIVSREDIINYLWESESFIDDNTLTVNIKRLRNKLEEINLQNIIETKRGQGYILK